MRETDHLNSKTVKKFHRKLSECDVQTLSILVVAAVRRTDIHTHILPYSVDICSLSIFMYFYFKQISSYFMCNGVLILPVFLYTEQ